MGARKVYGRDMVKASSFCLIRIGNIIVIALVTQLFFTHGANSQSPSVAFYIGPDPLPTNSLSRGQPVGPFSLGGPDDKDINAFCNDRIYKEDGPSYTGCMSIPTKAGMEGLIDNKLNAQQKQVTAEQQR